MANFDFDDDEVRDLLATVRKQIETSKKVRQNNQEYVDKNSRMTNCEQQIKLVDFLDGKISRLESIEKKLDYNG